MLRDVIITVFANSVQAPCNKWAKQYFENEAIVLTIPGGGGPDFRAKAIKWCKTGDLFRAALNELAPQYKDIEIGQRGLCTFSVGWSFADEILKFKAELERLNFYLLLDGCHTENLTNWIHYASIAAQGDAIMLMAHSSIKPPFISTTVSNGKIFDQANGSSTNLDIPDYITHAKLPEAGIDIKLGASPGMSASHKHWTQDPLLSSRSKGHLVEFHYDGSTAPDHCFIAWYSSERLWKWLGELLTISKLSPSLEPEPVLIQPESEKITVEPIQLPEQNKMQEPGGNIFSIILNLLLSLFKKFQ